MIDSKNMTPHHQFNNSIDYKNESITVASGGPLVGHDTMDLEDSQTRKTPDEVLFQMQRLAQLQKNYNNSQRIKTLNNSSSKTTGAAAK